MSSGNISQTLTRIASPRGGSKARETRTQRDPEFEKQMIEMIALKLIERRLNQPTALWLYDPRQLKSTGRRKTKEDVARRTIKRQLCNIAHTHVVKMMRELSKADCDRLVPRAVDFIFANGWMEVAHDSQVKYKIDRTRRVKGGQYARTQYREHRLVGKITSAGQVAYGRSRAAETNHPSTGVIPIRKLATVR